MLTKHLFSWLIFFLILIINTSTAFPQTKKSKSQKNSYADLLELQREREVATVEKLMLLDKEKLEKNKIMNLNEIYKGIESLRDGKAVFLKKITYKKYRIFIRALMILGKSYDQHSLGVLRKGRLDLEISDEKIINGLFGGLRNKDPRVRLSITSVLKFFTLTESQQKMIWKFVIRETTRVEESYAYIDFDLNVHIASPKLEIVLYKKFMERKRLVASLEAGQIHPVDFRFIKRKQFELLSDRIADEPESEIPLQQFGEAKIGYFIEGLKNKNSFVKQRCAEFIMKIYPKASSNTQKRIEKLKDKYFMLKIIFYRTQEELANE